MFGAARMREAGAGMGIAARRAHVRLGATGGPPSIRVLLGLTHFDATAANLGFSAMAVATTCGDATQQGRRVGEKRKCTGEEANG